MNYDENDISNKSQMITLVLLLFLGGVGAHRFYVNKYITGLIYLILGLGSPAAYLFNFGVALVLQVVFIILIIIDVYALYSETFTDSSGKLIVSHEKMLIYDTDEERERILFENRLNKIMLICLAVALYIIFYIVRNIVF